MITVIVTMIALIALTTRYFMKENGSRSGLNSVQLACDGQSGGCGCGECGCGGGGN
jgi:hypothetical protein